MKSSQRHRGLQIADMLADEYVVADAQCDRVLQMRSDRENGWERLFHPDRQRRITASTPQDHFAMADYPGNGVIDMTDNGAIVYQKEIRDIFQSVQRFNFVDTDRLVR